MTLYTPLTSRIGTILVMAETFSGLASMPRWETMYAKNALLGVELDLVGA